MADNELTGAAAPDGVQAPLADTIPVQTAASEHEALGVKPEGAAEAPAAETEGSEETKTETTQQQEERKRPEKLPDWAQKKLDEMAFNERQARREAKEAKEALERASRQRPEGGGAPNADDAAAARENAPAGGYASKEDFDRAVQQEADRHIAEQQTRAAQERFNEDCNRTYAKGVEEYPDFPDAVKTLQNLGAMTPAMIDAALATDNAPKVLYELGSDPEKAQRILSMPPAKMIAELTKLSLAPTSAAPVRAVSKAPPPVRPVEGSARVSHEPRDDDDDRTWFAKREAQRRERLGLK